MKLEKELSDISVLNIFLLTFCAIFVYTAFALPYCKLFFLLISGLLIGFYYGLHNHELYHAEDKTHVDFIHRLDSVWKHIVCGIIGAIALYFLSNRIGSIEANNNLQNLNSIDFFLFILSILAYMGLLPLTLWFIANSGNFIGKLIQKS